MDGVTQVATDLGAVKKAGHFLVLVQDRTAGGNLTWLESCVRARTLPQSRESGVFVSPGTEKPSSVQRRNAPPSRSGGGLPVSQRRGNAPRPDRQRGASPERGACLVFVPGTRATPRAAPGPLGEGSPDEEPGQCGSVGRRSGAVAVNRPDTRPDTDGSVGTAAPRQASVALRGEQCLFSWPPFSLLCPPGLSSPLQGKRWRSVTPAVFTVVFFSPGPKVCSLVFGHTRFSFRGLSRARRAGGPAAFLLLPLPRPGAVPLGSPGDGPNKSSLCARRSGSAPGVSPLCPAGRRRARPPSRAPFPAS